MKRMKMRDHLEISIACRQETNWRSVLRAAIAVLKVAAAHSAVVEDPDRALLVSCRVVRAAALRAPRWRAHLPYLVDE